MISIDTTRLRDDLTGVFEGDLLLDDLSRALYATDGSPFSLRPAAIARPRHEADVQTLVRYAAENGLPLTARGGGTGTAGAALGPGVIVDFARYMHSVVDIASHSVRVQPGVTWGELDRVLALDGLRLTVEPADVGTSTIGGLIASASAGPRLARLGRPHDQLLACRCVLDAGDAVDLTTAIRANPASPPDRLARLHLALTELLDRRAATIASERSDAPFDRCGYRLDVLAAGAVNYARLFAGSEGTLALATELTVRTQPRPQGRAVCLFGFSDLDAALIAALQLLPRHPSACVVLDRRLLSLLHGRAEPFARVVPSLAGAALVVEFESETQAGARQAAREAVAELTATDLAVSGLTRVDAGRLWQLVDAVLPTLADLRGGPPAVAGIDDVAVAPERLPEFLPRLHDILQRHETTAALFIHVAAGHVHARPFLDLTQPADAARLYAIAEDAYSAVLALGGTITTRHGTGLARTPWVAKQHPALTPVFRELKTIFDPRHLFNPGNIVGPDPSRPAWPMRAPLTASTTPDTPPVHDANGGAPEVHGMLWQPGGFAAQALACNGCGACRADGPPERMCPIFRAGRTEEASPRAKANLLRAILHDGGDLQAVAGADVRAIANLCVNCKMCERECPAHVNIPKLMLEAKAANVAEHGLDRADWVMARLGSFSALGSTASLLANRLLRGPLTRWFLEKFFGVSRRRRMPPFARRSFLRQARRWKWTLRPNESSSPRMEADGPSDGRRAPPAKAALFVDIFANYHDPSIAEAAVRVLQCNGVSVFVPPGQTSCGMEALAQGDVETARDLARRNLRVLAELVRDGFVIVCTEPTAALALSHDYLDFIDDPDVRPVAENTVELMAYLADRTACSALCTDFRPLDLTVGYHVPCHLRALDRAPASPALLRQIPGLRVVEVDAGCSGMAGTYGLREQNYETSLAVGQPLFAELRRPRIQYGATECSSCRLQMEEGAGKRTLHPVQFMALAYGLMPELERRLTTPVGGLVAT